MKKSNIKCSECEFCKGYKGSYAESNDNNFTKEDSNIDPYIELSKARKILIMIGFLITIFGIVGSIICYILDLLYMK